MGMWLQQGICYRAGDKTGRLGLGKLQEQGKSVVSRLFLELL